MIRLVIIFIEQFNAMYTIEKNVLQNVLINFWSISVILPNRLFTSFLIAITVYASNTPYYIKTISNNIGCCNSSKSIVTIVVSHHNYHNYIIIRNTSNITVGINIMVIMTLMYTLERALKRLGFRVELNLLLIDQLCIFAVSKRRNRPGVNIMMHIRACQWLHPCRLMKTVGDLSLSENQEIPHFTFPKMIVFHILQHLPGG